MIYFDNASTSFPKASGITKALDAYINEFAFNINRGNYKQAYKLEEIVFDTREHIKKFFNASDGTEVVFSSGITASINTFIQCFHKKGDHILISPIEHNAVMRPLEYLKQKGYITYSIIDKNDILIGDISKYVNKNTTTLIVNSASNVTGDALDIEALGKTAKKFNLTFMVDTAQSAGELNIDMKKSGIDYLAFTAHKGLLALQGLGGALVSKNIQNRIEPLVYGGTGSMSSSYDMPNFYPDKLEAGTRNVPGIVALGESLKFIESIGLNNIKKHKSELRKAFLDGINCINGFSVKQLGSHQNVGVVSVVHNRLDIAEIANALDENYGICTRVGLHCAPLLHRTIGTFENGGTLRFSFSFFNTIKEVEMCLDALKKITR